MSNKSRSWRGAVFLLGGAILLGIMILTRTSANFRLVSSTKESAPAQQGANPHSSSASAGEGNATIYVVASVPAGPGCPITMCPGGTTPGSSNGSSSNGPTYSWSCKWQPAPPGMGGEPSQSMPAGQKTGAWYVQTCMRSSSTCQSTYDICQLTHQTVWVQHPGSPTPAQPSAGTLAERARSAASLPSPTIHTAPAHIGKAPGTAVNLKTWLWIGSSIWHPVSTSATAGRLTATVTAVPVSVTWDTGDGHVLVCRGPGTPWNPLDGAGSQETSCFYIWRTSSLGQPVDGPGGAPAYRLSATINWEVSWSASDGRSGSLPPMYTSSAVYLPVMQIEAVN
jgi:hypothetical protein